MKQKSNSEISKQLNKLRRDKKFLWLGILFFVLVVFWILISIFTTTKTSSISPELQELAKPFVPRLESKVFDDINQKRSFSEEELSDFPIYIFDKEKTGGESTLIDINAVNDGIKNEPSIQPAAEADLEGSVQEGLSESSNSAENEEEILEETVVP